MCLSGLALVSPYPTLAAQKVASCSLPIVVRATLLADENPEWSTAMIYHRDKNQSQSYTINAGSNTVMPGVLIREIHKLAVIVDNRGTLERCTGEAHQFSEPDSGKQTSRPVPKTPTAEPVPNRLRDIFKAFADVEKAGVSGVGGAARPGIQAAWTDKFAVPGISGGPHGQRAFQVGRLQKSSIYYRLGIRNFDVVKTVNGLGFGSPEDAMGLAEKLRGASSLQIGVLRRGKTVNIDVNLDRANILNQSD